MPGSPRPPSASSHRRARHGGGWLKTISPLERLPTLAPITLAIAAPLAQGAAFTPGDGPDPPTGIVTALPAAEPTLPVGSGIRWELAPWRHGGLLALELREQRLEDGRRGTALMQIGDVDFASHVWQPWFVQVRGGIGWVLSRTGGEVDAGSGAVAALTGRAAVSVFPASRFPFELRADVSDSRAGEGTLGSDYRSRRLSLSQGWRPEQGNDSVQLNLDHSVLAGDEVEDRLTVFSASAVRQLGDHQFDFGATHSDHRRGEGDERTRLSAISLRHGFRPGAALQVETAAHWNETRLAGLGLDTGSDVRQVATFATWRLAEGALVSGGGAPLVAASARWVQAHVLGSAAATQAEAVNATLGLSQEFGTAWRAAISGSAGWVQSAAAAEQSNTGVNGNLSWAPSGVALGRWRWSPTASLNAGASRDRRQGARRLVGLQVAHGVARDFEIEGGSRVALTLNQSAAVMRESQQAADTRALAHGAGLTWQGQGGGGTQGLASLSYTDSLSDGIARGRFQLVNLQLTQRTALSRHASWSANLTAQATRNRASELDPFSGQRRDVAAEWQPYYNGGLNYEHRRAFGVPRLRFAFLASANSQPVERRALGDIDAPRERITESLETRLEYAIGRLEIRTSARAARVEGRTLSVLQVRAQRRF